MTDDLTSRDEAILRVELAEKIASLEPITRLGVPWQEGFRAQISHWRAVANGRPSYSEDRRDALGWALAHEFVLRDAETPKGG